MSKKIFIISFCLFFFAVVGIAQAGFIADWYNAWRSPSEEFGLSTFVSSQIGGSATANYVLLTDGSDSTWVATSTLGIVATSYSAFGTDFYTYFSATTTDYLTEGVSNLYSTQANWDTFWAASTTNSSLVTLSGLSITKSQVSDFPTYITSLEGQTGATQTFATSSDTNIGLTITSSGDIHTFTSNWLGTLADGRIASASTWNAKEPAITAGTVNDYWRGDKTFQATSTLRLTKSQITDFGTYENPLTFSYPLTRATDAISLSDMATTSLTATSPLSLSNPISVIGSAASALTISTAGDWTGTFDGQQGTYYLDAANFTNYYSSTTPEHITGLPNLTSFGTLTGLTIGSATTTASNGLDISGGCFAIGGTCLTTGAGTVTSVAMSVPTGLTIGGSPITSAGTLALTYTAGYEGLLTTDKNTFNNKWDLASTTIADGYFVKTGDWTGTLDGYEGSALRFATTTTDYWANNTAGLTQMDIPYASSTAITATDFYGALTGQAATVATIAGLAPDTATTQATQGNITSIANLVTVGALNSGSITSGFTSIDVGAGAISTTGLLTATNASTTLLTVNTIFDNDGDIGTAGQVLSSTGSVTDWIAAGGTTFGQALEIDSAGLYLQATTTLPFKTDYLTATSTTATSTFAGGLTVNNTSLVVDHTTGYVGFGTASPIAGIHYSGTLATPLILYSDASEIGIKFDHNGASDDWRIYNDTQGGAGGFYINNVSDAKDYFFIHNNDGFIGIGTTSPTHLLTVAGGSIKTSGTLFATSTVTDTLTVSGNLYIPNSAAPTVTTAGEIAIDTTSGQLKWYDGAKVQLITGTSTIKFAIASTTLDALGNDFRNGTTSILIPADPEAKTALGFRCVASSTALALVRLGDVSSNWTEAGACNGTFIHTSTNNTFTAWEDMMFQASSTVGTASRMYITILTGLTAN